MCPVPFKGTHGKILIASLALELQCLLQAYYPGIPHQASRSDLILNMQTQGEAVLPEAVSLYCRSVNANVPWLISMGVITWKYHRWRCRIAHRTDRFCRVVNHFKPPHGSHCMHSYSLDYRDRYGLQRYVRTIVPQSWQCTAFTLSWNFLHQFRTRDQSPLL